MMEYFTKVNKEGIQEAISLDLNFYHNLPLDDKIYSLWIFVKRDELDRKTIFDTLIQSVLDKHNAIHVASKEVDGWYEIYFYAPSEKSFTNTVQECLQNHNLVYESGSHKDHKFHVYLENLYPNEIEFHQIESRKIIAELEKEGDEITKERDVEHYAFFQTQANLERFIVSSEQLMYSVKQRVLQDESAYSYGVVLTKEHIVTLEVVQNEISDLLEMILQEHGYYEGWSTTLYNNDIDNMKG